MRVKQTSPVKLLVKKASGGNAAGGKGLRGINTTVNDTRSFKSFVDEIAQNIDDQYTFQDSAVAALREASEGYIAEILEEAAKCAAIEKRDTITRKDVQLSLVIRGGKRAEKLD